MSVRRPMPAAALPALIACGLTASVVTILARPTGDRVLAAAGLAAALLAAAGLAVLGRRQSRALERLAARTTALRAERHYSAGLAASFHDGLCVIDAHGAPREVNATLCEMTGLSREELLGSPTTVLCQPEDDQKTVRESIELVLRTGEGSQRRMTLRRRDGGLLPVLMRVSALRDGDGAVTGGVLVLRDVGPAERPEADRDPLERWSFLEAILDSLADGVAACDETGRPVLANRAAIELHGLPPGARPADLGGSVELRAADGTPLEQMVDCPFGRALGGESVREVEILIVPPGLEPRRVLVSGQPIVGADGRRMGAVAALHDVTARAEAEADLRRERDFSTLLLRSMQDGVAVLAPDGEMIEANERFCEMTGIPREELVGARPPFAYWPPEERGAIAAAFRDSVSCGVGGEYELTFARRDGERFPALIATAPVLGPQGEVLAHVGTIKDMSERTRAERAERRAAELLRQATDASLDAFFRMEAVRDAAGAVVDLRYADLNRRAEAFSGYRRDEMLGKGMLELGGESEIIGEWYRLCCEVLASGRALDQPDRQGRLLPGVFWVQIVPLGDGVAMSVRDVTLLRRAQERLRLSEEAYRLLAESSTDVVARLAPDGTVLYASPAVRQVMGIAPEDLVGRKVPELYADPESAEDAERGVETALAATEPFRLMSRVRHAGTGEWLWLESAVRPVLDPASGELLEINSAVRDVTDRVEAQEQLRRQRDERAALLGALKDGVMVGSPDGAVIEVNDALCRMLGFEREELVGARAPFPFWPREEVERNAALMRDAMTSPHGAEVEAVLATAAGERLSVLATVAPVHDATGGVAAFIATFKDVSARRRAEEALRRSNRFLEATLESLFDGVVACDADGALALFNRATREFHGLGAEPLRAESWADRYGLYRADGRTPLQPEEIPLARAFRGEEVHEAPMVIAPAEGSRRLILASGRPILDADGTKLGAVVAMKDVTERQRAESALARANRQLQSILAAAGEGICGIDRSGRIVYANPTAAALLGHHQDDLVGRGLDGLVDVALEASGEPTLAMFGRADGTRFPAEYVRSPVHEEGLLSGAVVVFRDVGERLELERRKSEFVAIASHELRTPLTSVLGYLGLLEEQGGLDPRGQRFVEVAMRNAERLRRLMDDVLTVAQGDAGRLRLELGTVDLADLVADRIASMRPLAEESRLLLTLVRRGCTVVEGDRHRLAQVVDNLLSNAIKFTPAGGRVAASVHADPSADAVRLEVADSGFGIPVEDQPRLFRRFERGSTPADVGGTGLGLAICKMIVEAHDGEIEVRSAQGAGSTFRVTIPLVTAGRRPARSVASGGARTRGEPA